jgi:cytochrome P450
VAQIVDAGQSYLEAALRFVQEPRAVHFDRLEDVQSILQDAARFTRPVPLVFASPQTLSILSGWSVFRDDAEQRDLRRVLIACLKSASSDDLVRTIEEVVACQLDESIGGGPVDVVKTMSEVLTQALLCVACGLNPRLASDLHAASESIDMAGRLPTQPGEVDQAVSLFTASARASSIYATAVQLAASSHTQLDQTVLAENIGMLMYGFFGPLPAALSSLVLAAATHARPVATDPSGYRAWLHECLRLYSPTAAIDRVAQCDAEIGETSLRAGQLIRCVISAANRDPLAFDRPGKFDAARANPSGHMSFGSGPHACIAVPLFERVGSMMLRGLAERNVRIHLDAQPIEWRRSINALGPQRLIARFEAAPSP